MPRNAVLIVMDTARADAFEPWGAATGNTPSVAQMARTGRCLHHVRSTANWTVPGHASLFSGDLPGTLALGKVDNAPQCCAPAIAAARDRWLPEVLRQQGYATAGVSANLWISHHTGFDFGFDTFESAVTPRHAAIDRSGLRARLDWALEGARGRADDGAARAEAVLSEWVDQATEQPFFWFVNLTECHSPYLPPRPYNDLSLPQRIRAADEARRSLTLESIWKTSLGLQAVPQGVLDRMRHLYDRSILSMDDWLGRVLQRMDERGLLDETVVIVTSDHGENFGECGLIGHCFSLDDRLLRVPVVASSPDFAPRGMTSLLEMPKAIATALELDDHPWADSAPGPAVAQWDAVLTDADVDTMTDDWTVDARAHQLLTTSWACAVEDDLKLLRRDDGSETLIHLADDPLESAPRPLGIDVEPSVTDAVGRLRRALDAAATQQAPGAFALPEVDVDDAEAAVIAKKMRELGYL